MIGDTAFDADWDLPKMNNWDWTDGSFSEFGDCRSCGKHIDHCRCI
jgi:hypothetical protein